MTNHPAPDACPHEHTIVIDGFVTCYQCGLQLRRYIAPTYRWDTSNHPIHGKLDQCKVQGRLLGGAFWYRVQPLNRGTFSEFRTMLADFAPTLGYTKRLSLTAHCRATFRKVRDKALKCPPALPVLVFLHCVGEASDIRRPKEDLDAFIDAYTPYPNRDVNHVLKLAASLGVPCALPIARKEMDAKSVAKTLHALGGRTPDALIKWFKSHGKTSASRLTLALVLYEGLVQGGWPPWTHGMVSTTLERAARELGVNYKGLKVMFNTYRKDGAPLTMVTKSRWIRNASRYPDGSRPARHEA